MISVTAAAFVPAAPRLWQGKTPQSLRYREEGNGGGGGLGLSSSSSQRRHFPSCSAANGSSGVYINQQLENGWLGGEGREGGRGRCLLCKAPLFLSSASFSRFFLSSPPHPRHPRPPPNPTFISHMVPPGAII